MTVVSIRNYRKNFVSSFKITNPGPTLIKIYRSEMTHL